VSGAETPGGEASSARWRILWAATFAQAGTAVVFLGVGALAGFLQADFGLSGAATGSLVAAVGLAPLFGLLPAGHLLDRYSERVIIAGGALVMAAGAALAAAVEPFPWILGLLVVAGAGYSSSQPGGSKVVAASFDRRQRGLAMGIRQTGLPMGGAVAAAVLPAVASRYGWRTALTVAAAVAAVSGLVFAGAYRPSRSSHVSSRASVRSLLRSRIFHLTMLAGGAMVAIQFVILAHLMVYLRDVRDIPLSRGAWMLAAVQLGGVAGRVALAMWSDRARRTRLEQVAIALLGGATGAIVLPWLPAGLDLAALIGFGLAWGFFAFGWYGPWVVYVAEMAPRGGVGRTLGLAMTGNQVSIVAAPPLFGLLFDVSSSYRTMWSVLAGCLVLVLVVVWLVALRPSVTAGPSR
jgi:MFS family permease